MSDDKDTSLVQHHASLGEEGRRALTLYLRPSGGSGPNTYFAVGTWAARIAEDYVKSSAVVQNWGVPGHPVPVVSFNEATFRDAVRDALLHHGVSVALYEKIASQWTPSCRGSPGNVGGFEAILFSDAAAGADVQLASLAAAYVRAEAGGRVSVGIAAINFTLRAVSLLEFSDNAQLSGFDAMLTQFSLKELLLASELAESHPDVAAALRRVAGRAAGLALKYVPAKHFSAVDVQRKMADVLRVPEAAADAVAHPDSAAALGCLLRHSDLASETSNRGSFSLKHEQCAAYVHLDAAAVRALHLVSLGQPEAAAGRLPVSIYGWLNRCVTGMGARLMRQWLLQPLRDRDAIEERLSVLEALVESPQMRGALRADVLRSCPDMDRLNKKLQRGSASLRDCGALLTFVNSLPLVIGVLQQGAGGRTRKYIEDEFVLPLQDICGHTGNLRLLIESSVDFASGHHARIRPVFDDDLQVLDTQRVDIDKAIAAEFRRALKHYGWTEKQVKCEHHSTFGHHFRVTRKDDAQVRANRELVTLQTSKDGVKFATPTLSALNEQATAVARAYDARQGALRQKLMETVATYLPVLDDAKDLIARLDVLASWATVAAESRHPMVRPTMVSAPRRPATAATTAGSAVGRQVSATEEELDGRTDTSSTTAGSGQGAHFGWQNNGSDNVVHLQNVRHPLVELRQADYVPNSLRASAARNAMIITGPNMGGKSTYMRSVGVAVVLAHAGCFVPAEAATVTIRDAVLCRVGSTDYMSQGVSTFMVEMMESSAILATATEASLVIIDELGRGTSTYDGFGLAWAIAQRLACTAHAIVLFATHFHELTLLADEHPNIVNAHVGADTSGSQIIRFLFRLEPGACNQSFGIHVAKLAGMPASVVADAAEIAAELENFAPAPTSAAASSAASDANTFARLQALVKRVQQAPSMTADERQALAREIAGDRQIAALLPSVGAAVKAS